MADWTQTTHGFDESVTTVPISGANADLSGTAPYLRFTDTDSGHEDFRIIVDADVLSLQWLSAVGPEVWTDIFKVTDPSVAAPILEVVKFGLKLSNLPSAGGTKALQLLVLTEANESFRLENRGKMSWGAGGVSATDVDLDRTAAGVLQITGTFRQTGTPSGSTDLTTKSYVDTGLALKINRAGDTMSGFLTLNADPSAALHAATKQYVDARTRHTIQEDAVDLTDRSKLNFGVGLIAEDNSVDLRTDVRTAVDVQVFTADGTWTKPSNITYVYVEVIGAGGGGGGGRSAAGTGFSPGGTGGGGGARLGKLFKAADLGATVVVVVGLGGTGGAANTSGTVGGNSSFGSFTVYGGGQGIALAVDTEGSGAGGGGTAGAGGAGQSAANSTGGLPAQSSGAIGLSGQGGGGVTGAAGQPAEYGGGAGGGADSASSPSGARSLHAAGGGGSGGTKVVAGATRNGGAGGSANAWGTGGGGAGGVGAGSAGVAGADGDAFRVGAGGGGGAASAGGTGGAGGNGGVPGGGGGGGGSGGGGTGGAGGTGGRGEVRVYSW